MTLPHHTFVLTQVLVEGLSEELAHFVEDEVRMIIEPRARFDFSLRGHLDLAVIVTDKMESHVDNIRQEMGKILPPYRRMKTAMMAAGMMLSPEMGPPYKATLVLDNELWLSQDAHCIAMRVYILAHEFGHAMQRASGTNTHWHEWPDRTPTHANMMRGLAAIAIDEFDADVKSATVCKDVLLDDKKVPVNCSEIFAVGFIDAAETLCACLEKLVSDVRLYRVGAAGLESLYPRAFELLNELLIVLTHTVALFAADQRLPKMLEQLGVFPGFRSYIAGDFSLFCQGLVNTDRFQGEQEMIAAVEGMLDCLGLRIEDIEGGQRYVHVHEPAFCGEPDPSDDNSGAHSPIAAPIASAERAPDNE